MYLEHFGLRQVPFRITPHTDFFFAGARRGATLEALIYAITHDEGIVKVSGEVGSGKTMLCRMLLERLPANVETVYLANPLLTRDELLFAIADELRVPPGEGRSQLLRALQERLLEIYAAGRQVVTLIDEAQAMPPQALEEIRLLSNLESSQHKLLQIVLFGQPELDHRLAQKDMRQLNERITHHFRLQPLQRQDVAVYLMFRLRAAGYRGPELFTAGALRLLSEASEGLTRRINILADKALLAAFSDGVHQIGRRQARAAVRDAQMQRLGRRFAVPRRWAGIGAAVCATAVLAYLSGSQLAGSPSAQLTRGELPSSKAAGSAATSQDAQALATADLPAYPGSPLPGALATQIAETEAWLKKTPDGHYVVQLFTADPTSQREVIDFLANHTGMLDSGQVRVYRSRGPGRERLGVIYGDYPARAQANAAVAMLSELYPSSRPYIRAVQQLRGPPLRPGSTALTH